MVATSVCDARSPQRTPLPGIPAYDRLKNGRQVQEGLCLVVAMSSVDFLLIKAEGQFGSLTVAAKLRVTARRVATVS